MSGEGAPRNPEGVLRESEMKKIRQLQEGVPDLSQYEADQQELLKRLEDEAADPRNRAE